jgi:6-phosphogluconolactonase (cycloisomerase 2 family)
MHMKFNKTSQLLLVSSVSLLAAGAITSCGTDTVDFVYVASSLAAGTNNYGQIDIFEINRVSGLMRQIPESPIPSGGRNPVAEAVSPDNTNLYVVNRDDNTIVQFLIGSDGKLYPQNTVNTPGIFPLAVATGGSYLFIADTYQPLPSCSPAAPCTGSVGVYPILTAKQAQALTPPAIADTLGPPVTNPGSGASYWPLTLPSNPAHFILPTAINVLASGKYLYVTAYDSSVTPSVGYLFGFSVGASGALTSLNGGAPFAAGVYPSAIASGSNSAGTYIFVTDSTSGNVIGFSVASATGLLSSLPGSPYPSGNQPSAVAVDPNYPYAYVANALDGSVSAYSISNTTRALTRIRTYATGVDPVAIGIDPGTSHFVFTANFLGNGAYGTVSDFELSTTDGTLVDAQHSPFTSNALPTAVAAIPHGSSPQ